MARFISNIDYEGPLEEHPAARAWMDLSSTCPTRIEILKEQKKRPDQFKSAVYRLSGLSGGYQTVVAKRCRSSERAEKQLKVFKDILPSISVAGLDVLGSVKEPEQTYTWISIETSSYRRSTGRPIC